MAEECKICFKEETLKRMTEETLENKLQIKDILSAVSVIKDSHTETKYVLKDINQKQVDLVLSDKENKAFMAEKFKNIEDKRIAEKLKRELKEEEAIKAKLDADTALRKEKRATRISIWVAVIILAINTLVGIVVKYLQL